MEGGCSHGLFLALAEIVKFGIFTESRSTGPTWLIVSVFFLFTAAIYPEGQLKMQAFLLPGDIQLSWASWPGLGLHFIPGQSRVLQSRAPSCKMTSLQQVKPTIASVSFLIRKKDPLPWFLCVPCREFPSLAMVLYRVRAGTSSPAVQKGAINKQARFFFYVSLSSSHCCLLSVVNAWYQLFPVHQKGQSFAQKQRLRFISGSSCSQTPTEHSCSLLQFPIFKMGIRNFLLHIFVQQGVAENIHGHNTQETQVPINCNRFEEWKVHITLKRPPSRGTIRWWHTRLL